MTVYAVANLLIHNRPLYERYVNRAAPVLAEHGGRVLAADDEPQTVEGAWDQGRVVLMAFPDRDAFTSFMDSPEYQDIIKDRIAATDGTLLLVRGLA